MTMEITSAGVLPGTDGAALPAVDPASSAATVHAGVLEGREVTAEYTLRQPAPRQWVAVGLVGPSRPVKAVEFGRTAAPRSLLVGSGRSPAASLGSLARRLVALRRGELDEPDVPRSPRAPRPE